MRQDGYSLELRTPAGLRLPEIQHQGVTYVVGRPGQVNCRSWLSQRPRLQQLGVETQQAAAQAYVVHAAAPLLTMNKPASKQLQVRLRAACSKARPPACCETTRWCTQAACDVDGRSTGLWLTLTLHHSTKAWTGFYLGNYRDIHKEQPFLFSEPHRFDVPGTSAAAADAGTVRVVFSIRGPFIGQSQRNGRGADPAPAVKKTEGADAAAAAAALLHVHGTLLRGPTGCHSLSYPCYAQEQRCGSCPL